MRRVLRLRFALLIAVAMAVALVMPAATRAVSCSFDALCNPTAVLSLDTNISGLQQKTVVVPDWLKPKKKVTYSVETRGLITADLAEFKQQANATLNDARGWSQLDATFTEVSSGGSFTLVLAEASSVPVFSPTGCSSTYSCSVGRYVIINQDRWLDATPAWNGGGGTLRDYRHMVINHETGHWLGHGHQSCGGAGQLAPVMQQQSIDLQGCTFNPWPLPGELWSSRI